MGLFDKIAMKAVEKIADKMGYEVRTGTVKMTGKPAPSFDGEHEYKMLVYDLALAQDIIDGELVELQVAPFDCEWQSEVSAYVEDSTGKPDLALVAYRGVPIGYVRGEVAKAAKAYAFNGYDAILHAVRSGNVPGYPVCVPDMHVLGLAPDAAERMYEDSGLKAY